MPIIDYSSVLQSVEVLRVLDDLNCKNLDIVKGYASQIANIGTQIYITANIPLFSSIEYSFRVPDLSAFVKAVYTLFVSANRRGDPVVVDIVLQQFETAILPVKCIMTSSPRKLSWMLASISEVAQNISALFSKLQDLYRLCRITIDEDDIDAAKTFSSLDLKLGLGLAFESSTAYIIGKNQSSTIETVIAELPMDMQLKHIPIRKATISIPVLAYAKQLAKLGDKQEMSLQLYIKEPTLAADAEVAVLIECPNVNILSHTLLNVMK